MNVFAAAAADRLLHFISNIQQGIIFNIELETSAQINIVFNIYVCIKYTILMYTTTHMNQIV